MRSQFIRLKNRFDDVAAVDFFSASGRGGAEGALADAATRLKRTDQESTRSQPSVRDMTGRTWVTRKGVFVDRIACAWLIQRFIDRKAEFKFVSGKNYAPRSGEVWFDMFDAEFTHEGDRCSFEVMIDRFGLKDAALSQLAEIIHDMDLKDQKYTRTEAAGIRTLFDATAAAHEKDEERLQRGFLILDDLYEFFSRHHA